MFFDIKNVFSHYSLNTNNTYKFMKTLKRLILIAICLFLSFSSAQSWDTLVYDDDTPGLEINPIRGLVPGFSGTRNFPYSMEFFYIGLRNTMNGMNDFDWTALENKLEDISNEGNTAIVRFYLDTPATPIATPQFLIDAGVEMRNYSNYGNRPGDSKSPDYNDPRTMAALTNFIDNFGDKYNGDPRISIVQGGVVGFWGEWHNYPLVDELGMSPDNKRVIFEKYIEAFPDTHINIREPQSSVPTHIERKVGYHDDSFAQSTIGETAWHFWPKMESANIANVWEKHPIGGEIFPPHAEGFWNSIPNPVGQDFELCVNTTHATYLLNHAIFDDRKGSTSFNNALKQNKLLGYRFYANGIKLYPIEDGKINFDLRIENRGIAPFYYDWDVEFALQNENGELINLGSTKWNINSILPENEVLRNFSSSLEIENGTYTLLMRVVNPLEAIKPNAKQLRFANAEQDANLIGWLSLKTFIYDSLSTNAYNDTSKFKVFPNPVSDSFTIELADENINTEASILNVNGKQILTFYTTATTTTVDVQNLQTGMYFVQLKYEDGRQKIKRLIIN